MKTWLEATAVGTPQADMFSPAFEGVVQSGSVNRFPSFVEEEGTAGTGRWMCDRPPACIITKYCCQIRADGNQPRLVKLGIAICHQGIRQVHVSDGQPQSFH